MNDREKVRSLNAALKAMAEFRRAFGRPLDSSIIAELYVAYALELRFTDRRNEHGYDLLDAQGQRYQVKHRDQRTGNVDLNSFSFDYLILLHLDEDYRPHGLWRLPVAIAKDIFVERVKFRKFQATQRKVQTHGTRLEVRDWVMILPAL
jgi:hypothetical protein